jgi:hypothetical protein
MHSNYHAGNPRPVPDSVFKLFVRDKDIPQGIRWAVNRFPAKKGEPAGGLSTKGYYQTRVEGKLFLNHRIIHKLDNKQDPGHKVIDHKKEKTNNNDVQLCTQQQNSWRMKPQQNKSSKYKGVSWDRYSQRWYARLTRDKVVKYRKQFKDEIEAALFYDQCALCEFGEFAYLNFPNQK